MACANQTSRSIIRTTSNTMVDDNIIELNPRSYQTEIMEKAKSKNLIVCLPTGSGKTYIAIMLIKELSPMVRRNLSGRGKRTIVLVKTTELARQHRDTMIKHLDLKTKVYDGSSKIKLQNREGWNQEFDTNQVLIFTAQTFLNLLDHNLFSLDQVNLLIFDECHHATGDDAYATIMKRYNPLSSPPRILGLTASISGQKLEPEQLHKAARELERIYDARIETGSDREEILENSTSVNVQHLRCSNYEQHISQKHKPVMIIFKTISTLSAEIGTHLKTKRQQTELENDSSAIIDQSSAIQLQCRTLNQLKSHLDNIVHIGHDLGLHGFHLGIKLLTDYLKFELMHITLTDQREKDLYEKVKTSLASLNNDELQKLMNDRKIRYSAKVVKVQEYIKNNPNGQCIVFVERVYTAAILCQVLNEMFNNSIKVKYVAGSKAYIDRTSLSTKYQRDVVNEFRQKFLGVLISTAIIEEGLDVPGCNLVIRFNKPQNFSSYMQSKGRARVRTGNALYVLLRDEPDLKAFSSNEEEYRNYESMEKMLKKNFKIDFGIDSSSIDDSNSSKSYQTDKGVKINAIRAMQIIYQYCGVLGHGQVLSPHFRFSMTECNTFKCVLSMPINCPIQEDITCENKNKKVAKQECCLQLVQKLHENGELDEYCLPILPERCSTTEDNSDDDDESEKVAVETFDKQIAHFFHECDSSSVRWYLYRMKIANNHDLGFIIPCERMKLPRFDLHGRDEDINVEIVYVKSIDFKPYRHQLEKFCRYIFEEVFDDMNTQLDSILKFDLESSTFKLLPCFLTKSDDIDYERMATVCNRKKKVMENPSELDNNELYWISYMADKQFFVNNSDQSLWKLAGDKWEHRKASETIQTYADSFEEKLPGIVIRRDFRLATMQDYRKPRINYLQYSRSKQDKDLPIKISYFPVEVVRYATLNQSDLQLIYKLPSILVRIAQLYHIEQLRQLFAQSIHSSLLLDVDQLPIVTFGDCLAQILSSNQSTALPLDCLNYEVLLQKKKCEFRLSPGLLFQSITRRSADEKTDMENLEILGDCFLKLAMSLSLYHRYPDKGSGKLTMVKDKKVSNENLYRLATKKNLKPYLNVQKPTYRGTEANWTPPGYTMKEDVAERYTKQKAKRKAFADMVEALIGAFLVSTDYLTTMKFMQWLGLDVIPEDQFKETPSVLRLGLSDTHPDVISQTQEIYLDRAFGEIEKAIKYVFKNKAYLIAAFTHPSYINNRLTQCYERLEYLGDAVIDFLIIRCIFVEHYRLVTPSQVTNIRHDLSNNGRFAYIFISCELQTKILHLSWHLFVHITSYTPPSSDPSKTQTLEEKLSKHADEWADPTAPKAFADVLEALVGAIFLDCGYNLETVWKTIEPLFRSYIRQSMENPNLNPIRSFVESGGKFIDKFDDRQGNFTVIARTSNGTEVSGQGRNIRQAKYHASQKAMKSI